MSPKKKSARINELVDATGSPRRKSFKRDNITAFSPPDNRVKKRAIRKQAKVLPRAAEGLRPPANPCSPPRSTIGTVRATDLRSLTPKEIGAARKSEMKEVVLKHFRKDVKGIAKPEELCRLVALGLQNKCVQAAIQKINEYKKELLGSEKREPQGNIEKEFLEFVPWLTRYTDREKEVLYCEYFSHFLLFLAHCICENVSEQELQLLKNEAGIEGEDITEYVLRLILPHIRTDINPEDSDCLDRVDVPLLTRPYNATIKMQPEAKFGIMLGVMEAKAVRGKAKQMEADQQLGRYTGQIYLNQDHRGSTWGMTCCETIVRICHLSPDGATSSTMIDITKDGGLEELISTIMAFSFASYDKLGYDPTISYIGSEWHIQMPRGINSGENGWEDTDIYVVEKRLVVADKLLGEHRRLFQVYRLGDPNKAPHLLDDYWVFVGEDCEDPRDEIQQQQNVTKLVEAKRPDLIGKYPKIVAGGPVYWRTNGKWVKDVVRFQPPGSSKKIHRVHKRVLVEQSAEPLRLVKSIPELIVILADVMEVYMALAKDCGVLHRGINEENILFSGEGSNAQGLLAGFENAIKKDRRNIPPRANRTIFPLFASIGVLEGLDCPRSELDDWESLLYLICHLGICGINHEYRLSEEEKDKHPIKSWCVGELAEIGQKKRDSMQPGPFKSNVLDKFSKLQSYWDILREMADEVHRSLFFNRTVERKCRGYKSGLGTQGKDGGTSSYYQLLRALRKNRRHSAPPIDPLLYRYNEEDVKEICEELGIMRDYKMVALQILEKEKDSTK